MRIFQNRHIRKLFLSVFILLLLLDVLIQLVLIITFGSLNWLLLGISVVVSVLVLILMYAYFKKQDRLYEEAVSRINRFLKGDEEVRIACDEEGEVYYLFQSINNLSSVLNAKALKEKQNSSFLKDIISDISHQLRTPLSALNIYNGLIAETDSMEDVRRFTQSSERELDRMDSLVKNLLKLAKLNAGTARFEKHTENISDIMNEVKDRFSFRIKSEKKDIILFGEDTDFLCDAVWLTEAFSNIVKNALDHMLQGGAVKIEWNVYGNVLRVCISDNGSGIHPEDLPHIFKRFYRSRFSEDRQGVGLGLALSKAIIEAHNGSVEVKSELQKGSVFSIYFIIPTKL